MKASILTIFSFLYFFASLVGMHSQSHDGSQLTLKRSVGAPTAVDDDSLVEGADEVDSGLIPIFEALKGEVFSTGRSYSMFHIASIAQLQTNDKLQTRQ